MNNSIYISIFGLNLSTITELKNIIYSQFSNQYKINWTNIADERLQILLINDDFFEIEYIKNINKSIINILKISKNENLSGEIENNILYLPLKSSKSLNCWLDNVLHSKLFPSFSKIVPSLLVNEEKQVFNGINHTQVYSAFHHIYTEYSSISNFVIQNTGNTIAFFDLKSQEFYVNPELNITNLSDLVIIPSDINTAVKYKKYFKAQDLSHAIWQFVWNISLPEVPQYTKVYQLLHWPQPDLKTNRNELLKISAYLGRGCSNQYIHEKTNISVETINRYLFACDIAHMIKEIPEQDALGFIPKVAELNDMSGVRGFFSNLRKKLGL